MNEAKTRQKSYHFSISIYIFIEKGRVTGIGTHRELVQKHELYREFAEQQLA